MRRIEILGHIASRFRHCSRRALLKRAVAWTAALPFFPARSESALPSSIPQPEAPSHQAFMKQADEMRTQALDAGDQGYGAVVVKDGKIVGLGPSRVIVNRDPTAHAEMEAIRDAARRLATRNLSGCTLYATFTPCPMCQTAAYWANMDKVIVGEGLEDAGRPVYGC